MKINFICKSYSERSSSFRVRVKAVAEHITIKGWSCTYSYTWRFFSHDVIFVSKDFSIKTIFYLMICKIFNKKVIFDLCDNYFVTGRDYTFRFNFIKKFVNTFTFSTLALKEYVENKFNLMNCHVIGEYPVYNCDAECDFSYGNEINNIDKRKRIVWFGNAGVDFSNGGMLDILMLKECLENLPDKNSWMLTIISNSEEVYSKLDMKLNFPTLYVKYNNSTFESILSENSISIIPVILNDFTIYKSYNRVLVSLLSRLKVFCSDVPAYREFKKNIYIDKWEDFNSLSMLEDEIELDDIVCNYNQEMIMMSWERVINEII